MAGLAEYRVSNMDWSEQEKKYGAINVARRNDDQERIRQGLQNELEKNKKKKGFWTDQISTALGIAGGIGGSFVAPVLGTGAGAALGSALGEGIENLITGESLGKNVAKEGVIGGVLGAGPVKLLKGAVGGAKALATGADDVMGAASKSATTSIFNRGARGPLAVTNSANPDKTLRTSVGGKINALGDKALMSQYGTIGKNVSRQTQPANTIKQLADIGITKPAEAERIANTITGSNGILNKVVLGATGRGSNVDTSTLRGVFNDALENNAVVGKEAKQLQTFFDAQMNRLSGGAKGSLSPKSNPSDSLAMIKSMEKRIADLSGKGGNYRLSTPERMDQANVLRLVKDELEDKLYDGAGANNNIAKLLTPGVRKELVDLAPKNKQWQKYVDDVVMKSSDISSLRSAQAPFVNINKIIQEGADNAMTFGGRASIGNGGTVANEVFNLMRQNLKNPVARTVSKPLRSFGQPIVAPGKGNQGISGALGIGARVGIPNFGKDYSMGPNMSDASAITSANANNMPSMTSMVNMPQDYQNTGDMSSSDDPFSQEVVQGNIQQILANNGSMSDVKAYLDVVASMKKMYGADSTQAKPKSQFQQERADLVTAMDNAENLINQGSINYGPVGARVEGIKSIFNSADPETLAFKNSISGLQAAITKARAGASLTEGELRLLKKYTPSDTDSEQVVRSKLAQLRQLYGYSAPTGGATTIEEALSSYR